MNNRLKLLISGLWLIAITLSFATKASADTIAYNQNVTFIAGSGNPDTGWTVATDAANTVSAAARIKDRVTGDTTNTNGVYNIDTGFASGTKSFAQFEFVGIVKDDLLTLSNYTWGAKFDIDSSLGVNMQTIPDIFAMFPDSQYGTSLTPNGAGVFALTDNAGSRGANSENTTFGPFNLSALLDGTYDFDFYVADKMTGTVLADSHIQLVMGAGGAPVTNSVPDGGTTALSLLIGLGALGLMTHKLGLKVGPEATLSTG